MHKQMMLSWVFGPLLLVGPNFVQGQDASQGNAPAKQQTESPKAAAAYRLDFSLIELEDGKKINTREYALNLVPGYLESNNLKIGTRVPVEMKQGEMQYLDVGTNIYGRMRPLGDGLQLDAHAEVSNFADSAQQNRSSMPLLRQLWIGGSTLVVLGKPMVIGAVDDPNSKRQFQLEVTVTKLR
jgi:hypothetical protein